MIDLTNLGISVVSMSAGLWLLQDPEIIHKTVLFLDSLNLDQDVDELDRANWARELDGAIHRFFGFGAFAYGFVLFIVTVF